jgi:FkbM family methyltransferase
LESGETELVDRAIALYQRIQDDALLPDDLVRPDEVRYDEGLDNAVERIYRSKRAHRKMFESFIPPFDVFRKFSGDDVVLDVGAHWGYSAVTIRHAGCSARIVSVEAMPMNMPALHRLQTLDPKYSCVNVAASDSESVLHFFTPVLNGIAIMGLSSTGGTLTTYFAYHLAGLTTAYPPPPGCADAARVLASEVAARRLDDILDERGELERVVAVKMDIEGHEPAALRGAERLFVEQRPLLMVEGANRNPAVVELMQGYGYFHAIREQDRLVPHLEMSDANDGFWVHPDRIEQYRSMGVFHGADPTRA